jgi:hypothetical protein
MIMTPESAFTSGGLNDLGSHLALIFGAGVSPVRTDTARQLPASCLLPAATKAKRKRPDCPGAGQNSSGVDHPAAEQLLLAVADQSRPTAIRDDAGRNGQSYGTIPLRPL